MFSFLNGVKKYNDMIIKAVSNIGMQESFDNFVVIFNGIVSVSLRTKI